MNSSTFATVAIPADAKEQADADLPGAFSAPYSADGSEPVTHYVGSGFFYDTELDFIVNDATWPRQVRFGDAQAALAAMGLVPVVPVDMSVTG